MNVSKALLEQRNAMKKKMPHFIRQDVQKTIRLKSNWRHPEGMHSKMRLKLRGNRRQPSIGFSSPKAVRGLSPQGHRIILVSSPEQLAAINEPITIASTVGLRKKLEIIKKAKEKKLLIMNIKDADAFLQKTEKEMKEKKEIKKKKITTKEQKKLELAKKAAEKEKEVQSKTKEEIEEEKIKTEKEEKKKTLAQGN